MPRKYTPDRPMSPVQQALATFPFTKWAEILSLDASTIKQWAALDRVPLEHLATVAKLTNREPLHLIQYQQEAGKPWPLTKTQSKPLDALLEPPRNKGVKQAQTLWGDRIQLLYDTLKGLDRPFDTQMDMTAAKVAAASTLKIQIRQLNRLIKTYQVNPTCPEGASTVARRRAQDNRSTRTHYTTLAIMGALNAEEAARNAGVTARTIYRYVDRTLTEQYGLTLSKLAHLPPSFRAALAYDARENEGNTLMSLIIKKWQEGGLNLVRKRKPLPENWKRVPIPDALIAVLRYETDAATVAADKETTVQSLEWLFTVYLKPLGVAFEWLKHSHLHHHAALADLIESLEYHFSTRKGT